MPTDSPPDIAAVTELVKRVIAVDARYQERYAAGEYEAAVEAAAESLRLLRELPPELVPSLPAEVTNAAARLIGLYLGELVRPDDALAPAIEAVEFCRSLPDADPRTFIGPLSNLHGVLFILGHYPEGVGVATELVSLVREVTPEEMPWQPALLARTLSDLCAMHRGLGQPAAAVRCGTEAVDRLAPLAAGDAALGSRLATTYSYLINSLVDAGDDTRAAEFCPAFLDACRAAHEVDPLHGRLLATALHTVSERYLAVGQAEDALAASAAALHRWRDLVAPASSIDDRSIAIVLYTFAEIRASFGTDLAAAEAAAREAVGLYQDVADQPPYPDVSGIRADTERLVDRIVAARGEATTQG